MNRKTCRLVYSRFRGMVVAVEETAAASGKAASGECCAGRRALGGSGWILAAASLAAAPSLAPAQIVPTPGTPTHVIQTQNGLPQVNIAKPSGAGMSVNTYNQFDVQKNGAILNNSPTLVDTQQAAYINGNPNFGPGQSARIIVNQVNSANASQLRGYVEVAGNRAEVVLANPAGIVVDGGGFINTSRATLTTGQPYYGADGSLAGYNVNRGLVTVQGAGLNATNVDQVDIIARAVQANAAIYAKNLNVVAGTNQVNHDTLAATPIQGDGAAPAVAIDVSQLGGMYSDRIYLVGTEGGVGVRNAGMIAAQAGDMTLQSNGRLVLTGKTTAAGNLAMSAAGGIDNSGTLYAQQSVSANTTADLVNSGTFAAQKNAMINAGSVISTGRLGAGVNNDGVVVHSGDLNVTTSGQLTATNQNVAGGNASLTGGSVNIAGSQTAAKGTLALNAEAGDLNLSGATTSAQGAITANAAGALINDRGSLSSGGGITLTGGNVSNQGGKVSAQGPLSVQAAGQLANHSGTLVSQAAAQVRGGAISNNQGTIQSAAGMMVAGASLDNSGGRVTSLNGDGLSVTTTGLLTNAVGTTADGAPGGVIGGNGDVTLQAGQLVNHGTVTAQQDLQATSQSHDNDSGMLSAGRNANIDAGATLTNASGSIAAGQAAAVKAMSLDNSGGSINAVQLALTAGDLANRGGSITQTGTSAMLAAVSGTFNNTGGTLQTNSTDLSLSPNALVNDHGKIAHAGSGALSITTGTLSNNGGQIATNGALAMQAAALSNQAGTLSAQRQASVAVQSLDNRAGGYVGADRVTLNAQGRIDNGGGTIEANNGLTVEAESLANDAGSIKNVGASSLSVTSKNALSNTAGGMIGGNGGVSVTAGSLDNSNGSLLSAQALTLQSNGALTNTAGLIQANGDLDIHAQGAIGNAGGQIEANGTASTLALSGSSIDNSDGRIVNVGTAATTIDGGASITNGNAAGKPGAGVIGGNGDVTVATQSLANTQGAQVLAGRDLTLAVANRLDNSNGVLSAANNATLNGPNTVLVNRASSIRANGALALTTASIDNTNGKIGNDAGSGGSVALNTGALVNQGGAIGSARDLTLTAGSLSGDGSIVAGRNGSVSLTSDYTHTAANKLHANGDLMFSTSGKLTNQGTLDANGALTVNAANVDNQAGADLNSANTTVNANGGTIDNAGRIEGDAVTTNSATLNNTATIIGRDVTLNAAVISNAGAAAVIAAANRANLYASNRLSNTGGASIFSVGDINIAANGQRDANGFLANRALTVLNDQSSIEALGSVELAAQTFTNTRPTPTVATETVDTTSKHESKRAKYVVCATGNSVSNSSCSEAVWQSGYKSPRNDSFDGPQVVSVSNGPDATDRVLVVTINGQPQTIYYNTLTNNADGTITVNYWDAYDPHVNYVPDTEYATRSDGHNGYQRVEISRDTTTTIRQDKVTSQGPQAELVAGRNIVMKNVGTIDNLYSSIAAGGSIRIGDADVSGSAASGSYGGTSVNNVGQTLYRYQQDDIVSTYAWNLDTTRDVGKIIQSPAVYAPVAIGNTGGTIVANQSINIDAKDVNNRNIAAENSATGATGGTLGANQANGGVTGTGQSKVGPATGQKPVDALQSVVNPTGALPDLKLPTSGLYTINPAPGQPYLIVTDPRLTSYTNFISSDYMLGQLNLNPASIDKRLGDGMVEQQMVRNQITQLTGRTFLPGYASAEDEYRSLMTSGANYAKQFGMVPGIALSAAQMDALTSDIVWLVNQTVTLPDGSKTQVLAPVVYLAKTHANDLRPTGALIAADDVQIHAAGSTTNSGVIKGGTKTVVTATDILNRGGTIASSGTNGTTVVSASNDVVNASGQITGNRVAVLAGRDVVNTTLVDTVGVSGAAGASKVGQSLIGQQGTIAATGDLAVQAGRDLAVHGANLSAGGNAQITAGRDINVDTVQSKTDQSLYLNDQHHWEESTTTHVTSGVSAGGNLTMQSGNDASFKGAAVTAGKELAVVAGGNLTATAVTDTAKLDNMAADSKTRQEVDHVYDERAVGTQFTASGNATFTAASADASKGNVTLTGSSLTAGVTNGVDNGTGAAKIAATGNVTLNEAREEHDNYQAVHVNRGSFVSSTKTDSMQDTRANIGVGSTVSGSTVNIQSGRDLTVQGSTVVGTNDVNLAAAGNVNITTSKDTVAENSYYRETHSGLGTSGLSVSIGKQSMAQTDQSTTVTNKASTIGSIDGNLNISAGKDLHVTGSDLIARRNITGAGENVIIDSATDMSNRSHSQETHSSGVTIGLSGSIGDAINGAYQQTQAARSGSGDSRATALHAIAAAGDTAVAVASVTGGALAGKGKPSVGVQVSMGSSRSRIDSSEGMTTQQGSNVKAGGTTTFVAKGNSTPGSGNITVAGSNVSGNDVILAAKNQINLQNTTNTDSTRSSNSSSSSSVGVSVRSDGFGVSASMQNAHGDGNSDAVMQNNSHVTGANSVTLVSGGDTNVIGSNVKGGTVTASVGGSLKVQSVQDTTVSAAHQSSAGGGFNVSTSGGSASFTHSHGNANGNYAGVNEQAGIQAGSGGFDIDVKGNTSLMGAYIGSTADASKNTLTTGTLTYSDIQNHSNYNADSGGFSAGAGVGVTGKATGPGSVSGAGGVTPMISQSDSGSQNATTQSGIGAGTINVTNPQDQTQDLANLNRDTSHLNGTVEKTPDVQNLLDKQSDLMNAASAAGQVVAQGIGAYADMKEQAAQRASDAARASGDTTAATAFQAEADAWAEGGANRVYLHIAGGGLIGGLGGGGMGSAAQGAAGAGLAALLAEQTRQAAREVAGATDSDLAGKLSGNLLAGAVGWLVGGTTGAATASNVNLYNQWNNKTDTDTLEAAAGIGERKRTTLLALFLEGVANGLSAVTGIGGGKPPTASPGLVLVGETPKGVAPVAPGIGGYWPGNVTLNSGNNANSETASTSGADGKSRNKPPAPLPEAHGLPHTIIERPGPEGQYTTHNGDGTWMQFRGSGQDHAGIPRPNVKETSTNTAPDGTVFVGKGIVRPARPSEIPKGK
ncbi:filamentous hemagglutinin N-terminal domain-containing protein [Burkholderia sp. Bp8963]|uniref:two-partner secretion domain-containing protein n=1 Tax=Burkholderia sp. Bp8963 TaxID=2184547 RepID=UPI000F59F95C|nr:hemagglutinin repeat-containing protein [Burkholderia sp. Bp8963]RQS64344.1 filamentous hemagglutinin N-terminal domain-containing protein [Burkholderia sp. Bp8963]